MNAITITHLPMQQVSSVAYKGKFIGLAEDGDSAKLQRLVNEAMELHDKAEKENWIKAMVKVSRFVYNLDNDELSEARMVEIIKEQFS